MKKDKGINLKRILVFILTFVLFVLILLGIFRLFGDLESPKFKNVNNIYMSLGETFDYKEGVKCTDNRNKNQKFTFDKSKIDFKKAGIYYGEYVAIDNFNNKATKKIKVTIYPKDEKAPIIYGACDYDTLLNKKVDYLYGVKLVDDKDKNPKIIVDSSKVNLKKEGDYEVLIKGIDKSKNQVSKKVKVHVFKKKSKKYKTSKKVFITKLNNKFDNIIDGIINKNMKESEKLREVFLWVHNSLSDDNKVKSANWKESSYKGVKDLKGSSYTYASVAKGLLLRLNFDSIIVSNYRGHYWVIVNYKGQYYHFDPYPHDISKPVDAFMLNMQEAEEYNKTLKYPYYKVREKVNIKVSDNKFK